MRDTTKTVATLAVVCSMLLMGAGTAFAAAPSLDNESTDTNQQTEITDGGAQIYNDSTSSNLSWSADSENSKIEIMQDGRTLWEGSPDPYDTVSSTSYYNLSLADDGSDYDGLEAGAGEMVRLNVTITNNTEADDPDVTNVSFTFANANDEAFVAADSDETNVEDLDDGWFTDDEDVPSAQAEDEVTISENTSTVLIDSEDSDLTDALDETVDADTEGLTWTAWVAADGTYLPVYSADADVPDELDDRAYGVLEEDGDLRIENAGELVDDDGESVDLTFAGNEALGLRNAYGVASDNDLGLTSIWGAGDWDGNPDAFAEV